MKKAKKGLLIGAIAISTVMTQDVEIKI